MLEPIFVDFETNVAGEVFLVSARNDDTTFQAVVSDKLAGAAKHHGVRCLTPVAACEEILEAAARSNRYIGTYSSHDHDLLRAICPNHEFVWFDVRKLAKRWIRAMHKELYEQQVAYNANVRKLGRATERWRFVTIARWASIRPPVGYAPGRTTARIEAVRRGLLRTKGQYEGLTPTQKRKFHHLLAHNAFDVEGLQKLYKHMDSELGGKLERWVDQIKC